MFSFGKYDRKVIFHIEVKKVVLPELFDEFEGTETIVVSLERKNKPSCYTKDAKVELNDNDEIFATFNEMLTTEVTLHGDGKPNKYKEKLAGLSVLQRKYGVPNTKSDKSHFKTLGIATLRLHQLVDNTDYEVKLPLEWCISEKAYVIISVRVQDKDGTHDTGSIVKDDDDVSSITSDNRSITTKEKEPNKTSSFFGRSNSLTNFSLTSNNNTKGNNKDTNNDPKNDPLPTTIPTNLTQATSSSSANNNNSSNNNKSSYAMTSNKNATTILGGSTTKFPPTSSIKPTNGTLKTPITSEEKLFFQSTLYQDMKTRIDELELALLSSQEIVEYERRRANETLQKKGYNDLEMNKLRDTLQQLAHSDLELKQQIQKLEGQLAQAKEDNRQLQESNDALNSSMLKYGKEGVKIQTLINDATNELNLITEEKNHLEKTLKDKNDECENLLQELIKNKVTVGELSQQVDELKRQLRLHQPQRSGTSNQQAPVRPNLTPSNGQTPAQRPSITAPQSQNKGPAPPMLPFPRQQQAPQQTPQQTPQQGQQRPPQQQSQQQQGQQQQRPPQQQVNNSSRPSITSAPTRPPPAVPQPDPLATPQANYPPNPTPVNTPSFANTLTTIYNSSINSFDSGNSAKYNNPPPNNSTNDSFVTPAVDNRRSGMSNPFSAATGSIMRRFGGNSNASSDNLADNNNNNTTNTTSNAGTRRAPPPRPVF